MKILNSAGVVGLMMVIATGAHARLPENKDTLRVQTLRGSEYGALSSAITDFQEVPPEDHLKSAASGRALAKVRQALRKLGRAPGQLPLSTAMSDEQLAKAMKGIRVADAFCNMPVVSFFIVNESGGLKIEPHYSYDSAPTLEEVRERNPGCDVRPVHFSSSPAAAR